MKPPTSRTAHGQTVDLIASPSFFWVNLSLSPLIREVEIEVENSTVYDEIADLELIPAAVTTFLRYEEGRVAYTTAASESPRKKD